MRGSLLFWHVTLGFFGKSHSIEYQYTYAIGKRELKERKENEERGSGAQVGDNNTARRRLGQLSR